MPMGCEEVRVVVEKLWNARFAERICTFLGCLCGKLLFHVEHFRFGWGLAREEKRRNGDNGD
jgi:hypothetical protein